MMEQATDMKRMCEWVWMTGERCHENSERVWSGQRYCQFHFGPLSHGRTPGDFYPYGVR